MKILHVITSLSTGGAEKLMVDLLPELRSLGNEIEILIFNETKTPFYQQLKDEGIVIHSLQADGWVYNPLNIFRLMKYIRKYDIIHTHNTACQLFVPIAKLLSASKVKLFTTEHNSTNRRRNKKWLKPFDNRMYNRYKKIICISDQTADNLRKYLPNLNNIEIIYNGINISKFRGPIGPIENIDNIKITMVAGFRIQKDQDTLIRAIARLPENYRLQLVGDGIRRPEIESLIDRLSLRHRVKLLGIRSDIPEILRESDIIVLSSHWEGLSLSSVEGMASGKPFIASDVDGLHEIVDGYGILFPDGDDKALAKAIQSVVDNPEKYVAIAKRCQEKALQYDIKKMAREYNELYQQYSDV